MELSISHGGGEFTFANTEITAAASIFLMPPGNMRLRS
jgi:hypothetical protein